ncbi:MAG: OmpH family outer membrane protein [Alphaproteobacteria bacterium]|nr:OmpH family outer membrane protein [Alphaproteobacteria bacterium]
MNKTKSTAKNNAKPTAKNNVKTTAKNNAKPTVKKVSPEKVCNTSNTGKCNSRKCIIKSSIINLFKNIVSIIKVIKNFIVKSPKVAISSIVVIAVIIMSTSFLGSNKADIYLENISSTDVKDVGVVSVAVIKMEVLQQEALVMKSLKDQLNKFQKQLEDEGESIKKSFEVEKIELEKQQGIVSKDAFQQKITEYQQNIYKQQKLLSEKGQALETEFQKALAFIQKDYLDRIIQAVANKKGIHIILDGRSAQTFDDRLDITDDVIKTLDNSLKDYRIKKPKGF